MKYVGPRRYFGLLPTNFNKRFNATLHLEIEKEYICAEIGAFIGAYAIRLAKMCKRVYAIEPHPDNIKYLKKNVDLSGLNNIEIIECAVGSYKGKATFFGRKRQAFSLKKEVINYKTMIEVEVNTIDNMFKDKRIDFIRMQINGTELDAIRGAQETMKKLKKIVIAKNRNIQKPEDTNAIETILNKYFDKVYIIKDHIYGENA